MPATILAIETATACCSVALSHQGELSERSLVGNNVHSQVLLKLVQELLQSAAISVNDLTAVAVGHGPGSFTGLRIGVGIAQGIAYGADCPMIGISSLDALAVKAPKDGIVLAGIDARMGEVYWAEYIKQSDSIERVTQLYVSSPDAIAVTTSASNLLEESVQFVGNAWQEYAGQLDADLSRLCSSRPSPDTEMEFPSASGLISLAIRAFEQGETVSAKDFSPQYVRNDVAKKAAKKKAAKKPAG